MQSKCQSANTGEYVKENDSESTSKEIKTQIVFLVTTPMGKSFESIVQALGNKPPLSVPIDWMSHDNRALPQITSRVRFATHYALCLISREIWLDDSLTLLDKFKEAKFWDHPGDSTGSTSSGSSRSDRVQYDNECKCWPAEHIVEIDSAQEIGETTKPDKEVSKVYRTLRRGWIYLPLWWNCHDLAIRLAYLLVHASDAATNLLKTLLHFLQIARFNEVSGKFALTGFKIFVGGWTTCAGSAIAAALLGPLGPVVTAVGLTASISGWSLGFVSEMVNMARNSQRKNFETALEKRFPQLRLLHN
ncbi:hypothetical protein K432DRAFT_422257 [Lepidopterella palustris CBS 459.81]|uniref:Uncharacterized protein n=1 Tax=Lepidopterella palustris CBS 459.81 TaxID=1314670 RepID=A0A8E2EIY2_9PEZI|nr:hypothetical protein K432DRAFT_422257 [Lepidopterella palustris CBS 459.81]